MKKNKNPIALQSQNWLLEALLFLMKVKSFKDITIKEIAEKAGLDRRTFYRNFDSKEDVLNLHAERLSEQYIEKLKAEEVLDSYHIAKVFFEFSKENIDFLMALKNSNMLIYLLSKYDAFLPNIHNLLQNNCFKKYTQENFHYAIAYNVGGYWYVLVKWLEEGAIKSPEEMASLIRHFIG